MKKKVLFGVVAVILISLAVGLYLSRPREEKKVTIGYQYTFSHIGVIVLEESRSLEEKLPGWKIEYLRFSSGAAMRNAMIAGEVQMGLMGPPPYLIGLERGVRWKIAASTGMVLHPLMTWREDVKDVSDLAGLTIAMPSPGSLQHILLAIELDRHGLSLDDVDIVSMKHPEAAVALQRHDIDAHFGTMPFNFQEESAGCHEVFSCFTVADNLGEFLSEAIMVIMSDWAEDHPDAYKVIVDTFVDTLNWVEEHPYETLEMAKSSFPEVKSEDLELVFGGGKIRFDPIPHNIHLYAEWMQKLGFIEKVPERETLFFQDMIEIGAD